MLSIDQIASYMAETIARDRLAGDKESLRRTQYAAGVIMHAAEAAGDRETARRFRTLAAESANKQEEIVREKE